MKKRVALFIFLLPALFVFSQDSFRNLYKDALIKYSKGDYTGALADVNLSLIAKTDFDSSLCLRGVIYYRLGQNKESLTDLDKVIKSNPDYFDAVYTRGIVKGLEKDYVGAMKDLNKAVELKPNNSKAYYNRALVKGYRSEERRVGKECRSRWWACHEKKK